MLACVDVCYGEEGGRAAAVLFESWDSDAASDEYSIEFDAAEDYVVGEFYKRELPCILALFAFIPETPEVVIVDAYSWLRDGKPGLGAYLHEALGGDIPVVGVAKNEFAGAPAIEVLRGDSERPLYVTAAGMDASRAAELVRKMHGPHRIPTLLKRVDKLARNS